MLDPKTELMPGEFPSIRRRQPQTLQVNLGRLCNQQCLHCHVAAGPNRTEIMSTETIRQIREVLETGLFAMLDLTGGAPELNPGFHDLVRTARAYGLGVIDRCNLTILQEPGQEGLAEFLAGNRVEVVASLPCYLEENVDRQRGNGVFERSLAGLTKLNSVGYGDPGGHLMLNLVYNPQDASLPPPQGALEDDYRRILDDRYGVRFNKLLALSNLPIGRFGSALMSKGKFHAYMELLKSAHCDANLDSVMCRDLISVDWRGYLYDCDFNQMLDLPLLVKGQRLTHVKDLPRRLLDNNPIVVGDHCYGCTAGQGSSCGGALSSGEG